MKRFVPDLENEVFAFVGLIEYGGDLSKNIIGQDCAQSRSDFWSVSCVESLFPKNLTHRFVVGHNAIVAFSCVKSVCALADLAFVVSVLDRKVDGPSMICVVHMLNVYVERDAFGF